MRARLSFLFALVGVVPLSAQRFAAVDAAVRAGISAGIYPGAVVVIGRSDTVLYAKGYGRFTWDRHAPVPDPKTTLWDIASLSKVVGTASAAAVLVDQGRLALDAPVSRYLPAFTGGGKESVTVRMLLDHTSGLPAWAPIARNARSPDDALAYLLGVPLARRPGTVAEYSDLNAILAGLVVSQAAAVPLDQAVQETVLNPLGMTATRYRPMAADRTRTVPTRQNDRPVSGLVNDDNARAFDGVAGHAGIFSTGLDLARFAQGWLRDRTIAHLSWLVPSTMEAFAQRSSNSGTRALGWDTPHAPDDGGPSLYGRCATPTTIGHTGWTGTALWLDRSADLFVVLLTNRSYAPRRPTRSFEQIRQVRAKVSDAARRGAIGECRPGLL